MSLNETVKEKMKAVLTARAGADEAEETVRRNENEIVNLLLNQQVVVSGMVFAREPLGNGKPTVKLNAEQCKIIGVSFEQGTDPARDLCWIKTSDGRELWCDLVKVIDGPLSVESPEVASTA